MTIEQLIERLENIKEEYNNCEIYVWDNMTMSHYPISNVKYITENSFSKLFEDDEDYVEDFNKIKNNIVLI